MTRRTKALVESEFLARRKSDYHLSTFSLPVTHGMAIKEDLPT